MSAHPADLILAGASLSNCLMAWFVKRRHPRARVVIFERASHIPGHRTWSFHRSDVGENYEEISPLITRQWEGYDIHLPRIGRSLNSSYCTIRPDHLQHAMRELLGDDLIFSAPVAEVAVQKLRLEDGASFHASCVLDGRNDEIWRGRQGYQKFVGLNVHLEKPHGLTRPILMDAGVPQADGYRFFYILPWSSSGLLIEDTRYSATPEVDMDLFRTEIESYAASRGWKIASVEECETGSLAIPLSTNGFFKAGPLKIGVAGGFFHPVTGYSLPVAVELADRVSRLPRIELHAVRQTIANFRRERAGAVRFFCMLNRMMFMAAPPQERFRIFEHFYALPESTIQRFYAGNIQFHDTVRILCGRPPVRISAALRSMVSEGAML